MEKLAIFIIIALAVAVIVLFVRLNKDKFKKLIRSCTTLCKKDKDTISEFITPVLPKIKKHKPDNTPKPTAATIQDNMGFIEQINANGEVIFSYDIPVVTDYGVCINREGAEYITNQITVSPMDKGNTISSNAYYIFYNKENDCLQLCFHGDIEKNGNVYIDKETGRKINNMYYYNEIKGKTEPVANIFLIDGLLFCLGQQWFRFVAASLPDINPTVFGRRNASQSSAKEPDAPAAPPVHRKVPVARTFADNDSNTTKTYPPIGKF